MNVSSNQLRHVCAFEQVSHWLMDISQVYDGAAMKLDEQGCCHLASESGIQITIVAVRACEHFRINIELMPVTPNNKEKLFEKSLSLNHSQHRTLGAAIAVDSVRRYLVLSFVREVQLTDSNQFHNALQNLIEAAKKLREELDIAIS